VNGTGLDRTARSDALENNPPKNARCHLIEVQDSVLVVIDVQDHFLKKIAPAIATSVVERIRWLVQVANWLQVPVIITAENSPQQGSTTERIRSVALSTAPEFNKIVFGLAEQPDILQAVRASGRRTAVLVGLETDVCVQHSAFGLARLGYEVAVVVDATASPDTGHALGLDRMRAAGIAMVGCKGIFYEWTRDTKTVDQFIDQSGIEPPADLML
jgi:nicotinamidase-related amidase